MGFHAANRPRWWLASSCTSPTGGGADIPRPSSSTRPNGGLRYRTTSEHRADVSHLYRSGVDLALHQVEWPDVLDAELDDLVATHPNITLRKLPLTHTGPATDGVDMTVAEISAFLSMRLPKAQATARQELDLGRTTDPTQQANASGSTGASHGL